MRKELFESSTPGIVKMFVCGPTIQDYIHLGHARTYIFYDLLARYLKYLGYDVELIINITDIDESIVRGARIKRRSVESFLSHNERAFLSDMKGLRISTVSSFERVSDYLSVMVQQVSGLIRNGHAYASGGAVFFDVTRFHDFGRLSHQAPGELSLRPLEISPKKRHQIDFSLWRATTDSEQRWESPWGRGTPGWHVQDTAVSMSNFGPQYDIHGGARELVYPHHEAEIAQAESLTGLRPFVKYWVHTGLLTEKGRKMSKSEGNVFYVRDLLKDHDADSIRLYFAGLHHRRDSDFSETSIVRSREVWDRLRAQAESIRECMSRRASSGSRLLLPFLRALNDDIDGPRAITSLERLAAEGVRERDPDRLREYYAAISTAAEILGIRLTDGRN